jgi:hypothetical protein
MEKSKETSKTKILNSCEYYTAQRMQRSPQSAPCYISSIEIVV